MLGNQIAAGVGSVPDFIDHHKAGKLRVVGRARQRSARPRCPTCRPSAELGLTGFEDVPYYGVFAPAGTPKADARPALARRCAKVIALPEVRERLTALGLTVAHMPRRAARRARARLPPDLGADHQGQRLPAAVSAAGRGSLLIVRQRR